MRISPINYYCNINRQYNRLSNVNFGYRCEEQKDENGVVVNRNTTAIARAGLHVNSLPSFLEEVFPGDERVIMMDYGCSTGEEPSTIFLSLHHKLKDKAIQKYCPIIAKDINPENIDRAKNGNIIAIFDEVWWLKQSFGPKRYDYFYITDLLNGKYRLTPKPLLADNIKYFVADIREDSHKIPNRRVVLSCRNFWPYLSKEDQHMVLKNISQRLTDDQNLLIVGDFDLAAQNGITEDMLKQYGFEQTKYKFIYRKIPRK